jgi:hypothetical protein
MTHTTLSAQSQPHDTPTGTPSGGGGGGAARLVRLARWTVTGRLADAELELHAWRRRDDCPPAARTLLASLLARRGRLEHALAVTHMDPEDGAAGDAGLAELRIALLVEAGRIDEARCEADALRREHGHDAGVNQWLTHVGFAVAAHDADVTETHTDDATVRLTDALAARPHVLLSLVAAQRVEPDPQAIALLRNAAAPLSDRLTHDDDRLTVCQAMADLCVLAGDLPAARLWAHRGLRIEPYVAGLALILARTDDDAAAGPPAADVLRRNAEAHPTYPDVQAALVRRLIADGRADEARRAVLRWNEHAPGHPLLERVRKELAA